MRSERCLPLVFVALASCAVSLDPDAAEPIDDDEAPHLTSCALEVSGKLQSLAIDDDAWIVADQLETTDGPVANVVARVEAREGCSVTLVEPIDGLDASALGSDVTAGFGAVFAVDGAPHAFVRTSRGFESIGTTLARWSHADARFVAQADYLFAADGRPSYGDAALVADGFVYAYGVAEAGFLAEDCFVARAPIDALGDPTAWRYYRDGNDFGAEPDDAWPIFPGGGGLAVMRHGERVLVAYHTPLGQTVYVRTGLGPTGPWSPPVALTTCTLPDDGFCGALSFHPTWSQAPSVTLTQGVIAFEPLTAVERATRLFELTLDR